MPIVNEYESKQTRHEDTNKKGNSQANITNAVVDDLTMEPVEAKTFEEKLVELISSNLYDQTMVSKHDMIKVQKKLENHPTLEQVAARLFEAHERHLARIEQTRKEVEEQRYLNGGGDGIDRECRFKPEINHRKKDKDKEQRTLDKIIRDLYEFAQLRD